MGTNTVDTIQVYALVPNAQPNQGQPSTKDATNAQVAQAYEANPDTNKYTDAEKAKLASVQSGAQVNPSNSDGLAQGTTNLYMTGAEKSKLTGIESGAQVNPNSATIKAQYESNLNTNAYTDAEKSKLAGIQAGAQVNPANTDSLSQGATNLYMTSTEKTKLAGIQAGAQVNPTNTDSLAEGSTNKYQSTENKRGNAIVSYNASTIPSPIDTQLARRFIITMDANIASLSLNNGAFDGQFLMLIIKQDATGGRTLGYNAGNTQGGFDVGVPVLNGTANSRDYHLLVWNATNSKWDFLPNLRRYP